MSRKHELTVQELHQVDKPTKQSIHCKRKIANIKVTKVIQGKRGKEMLHLRLGH